MNVYFCAAFLIVFFMKRIAFVFLVLVCLTAFVSCNKNGVFRPKENISSIWYESEEVAMFLRDSSTVKTVVKKYKMEDWEWDGKDLKTRIVYNRDNSEKYNYVYEYNKENRIIGITSPLEKKTRIRFIYNDDKKIKEIKYFTETFSENDLPYRKIEFTYDGNKVMSIKETINNQKYPRSYAVAPSLLSYLVSEDMAEEIEANTVRPKIEYNVVTKDYVFEWDGKNISKVTITTNAGGNPSVANISYTYDEKKNPFMARVTGYVEDEGVSYTIASKNNVVSCSYSDDSEMTITEDCQYTYDKKYPVAKMVERVRKTANALTTTKATYTYEYLK